MTKNQLREVVRHLIKKELLNEALYLPPVQVAYFKGYEDAKNNKPADINYYRQYMEPDKTSLNEMPGLKIFNKDDSNEEAFKKGYKYGFKDGRLGKMTLKNALSLEENQWEPEEEEVEIDTDTEKGRPLIAPGAPGEEGDDEEYDEPFKAEKIDDIRRKIINRLKNKM
jgi:hypothetical protein